MLDSEKATTTGHNRVNVEELLDDPELEHLYAERVAAMQKEAEKRAKLKRQGHGEFQEVQVWSQLKAKAPVNFSTGTNPCICYLSVTTARTAILIARVTAVRFLAAFQQSCSCPQEGDFLEIVRTTERCVCHFFHKDFERCKILNQHLAILAAKYLGTRFIRLSAPVRLSFPAA